MGNNFNQGNNEIRFNNPRQLQPRVSMPQLNFNPSMLQQQNFEQQYQSNFIGNTAGNFGVNPMTHRNLVNSTRNLGNYASNKNFNTFGGNSANFMGNQTTRYPPEYFNANANNNTNTNTNEESSMGNKQLIKSKSQKRKIKKKGSRRTKGGKTKNQALNTLEVKFGAMLCQLKEDSVVDMNMENANISDLEIRALGQILSQSKKLRKISFKRNSIT